MCQIPIGNMAVVSKSRVLLQFPYKIVFTTCNICMKIIFWNRKRMHFQTMILPGFPINFIRHTLHSMSLRVPINMNKVRLNKIQTKVSYYIQ